MQLIFSSARYVDKALVSRRWPIPPPPPTTTTKQQQQHKRFGGWPMPIPCYLDRKEQRPRSSSTTRACNGTSRGVSRAACQDSDLGSPESWLRRGHTYARAGGLCRQPEELLSVRPLHLGVLFRPSRIRSQAGACAPLLGLRTTGPCPVRDTYNSRLDREESGRTLVGHLSHATVRDVIDGTYGHVFGTFYI